MSNTKEPLVPGGYYHIFNKTVGNELLFLNERNYSYFLHLAQKHLIDYMDILSYCLMPDHFHLVIQVKPESIIHQSPKLINSKDPKNYSRLIAQQFSNLFNSYAQAFNKVNLRSGSLFKNRFQRKRINNEKYLIKLVHYIHHNPVIQGLCGKPEEWKFSSYNALVSNKETLISRNKVIKWFEDVENFKSVHKLKPNLEDLDEGLH